MANITFDQPYNLKPANAGLLIDVKTTAGVVQTSFTAGANGIGVVTLTVTDASETTLYFVRNLDGTRIGICTFDPTDRSALLTLLSRIASALTITSGKVDVNDKTGFSLLTAIPTAAQNATAVAAALLVTPANKIYTDVSGWVKAGAFSASAVQSVWDQLTSGLTLTGSVGKLITDISTLLGLVKGKTDTIPAQPATEANVTAAKNAATDAKTSADAVGTAVGQLHNLDAAAVKTAAGEALTNYDGPTRAEATEDKEEILTGLGNLNIPDPDFTPITEALASIQERTGNLPDDPASQQTVLQAISEIEAGGGGATVEEILAATRGSGDWLFNPIVKGANAAPLSGALVTVRVGANQLFWGFTDNTGRVRFGDLYGFALAPGNYSVLVRATRYEAFAPQTLAVTNSDVAPVYQLTPVASRVSEVPGMVPCDFVGVPFGLTGQGLRVELEIVDADKLGSNFFTDRIKTAYTVMDVQNKYAFAQMDAWPGVKYKLTVTRPGGDTALVAFFIVPEEGGEIGDFTLLSE